MVAAFVRSHGAESVKAAGTTDTYALTATVPAGNLLVMALVHDNSATTLKPFVSSITKMSGETASWVHLGRSLSASTSTGAFADGELWMIKTTVDWTSGTSLTVTYDTSITMKSQNILEFSGVEATLRSTTGVATYSTTTTAASATTTGTAPVIGDLAIGLLFGSNVAAAQAGDTDTTGGSWSTVTGVGSTGGSGATNNFGITQYKIVTSTSHQTFNNSAAMTAGNGAIVAILQATIDPLVTQAAYRIYDDGTETGSTALAAQDTAPTVVVSSDANVQVRVRLQETAGGVSAAATDWQLQWEKNTSGTWGNVAVLGPAAQVDGYPESNADGTRTRTNPQQVGGQSFLGNGQNLVSAGFYLSRSGTVTTTCTARLYAHGGTFGNYLAASPGALLATSTARALSLGTTGAWFDFDFDGSYVMGNGTAYYMVLVVESISGGGSVLIALDLSSPSHAGSGVQTTTDNFQGDTGDYIFRVYSALPGSTVLPYDSASLNVPVLADTYPAVNRNSARFVYAERQDAQTFVGNGGRLSSAKFSLAKAGTPTGTIRAALYATTAGAPTGLALATSSTVMDPTTLTAVNTLYAFDFDQTCVLADGTTYAIALVGAGGAASSADATIAGIDSSSPTHAGAEYVFTGTWAVQATVDLIFEVYTVSDEPTTNRLGAGSGSFVAGKVSEDGLVDDLGWTASNYTELLYSVTLKSADLANADSLRFRVLRNGATTGMTYTSYPTITVSKVTTPQGAGTGSWSFTGTGVGYRLPKATPTGTFTFTGAAVGKRTPKAVPVGAWSFAGSAVGAAPAVGPKTGTAAGTWAWVGAAVGKRTPVATVTGAWSFVGAAVGKRTPKATPTGAWSFAGTAAGVAPVVGAKTGTASGAWSFTGAAVGKRIAGAAPTGTLAYVGAAVGKRIAKAAPTGAWSYLGAVVGKRVAGATGTGTWTWTGAAVGKRAPKATTAGTLAFTGAAVGYRSPKATTTGTLTWTGAAVGLAPTVGAKYGTASGAWSFAGAAVGKRVAKAAPTGTFTFTGAAVGEAPPNTGAASGTLAWTGVVVSKRNPKATTAGTFAFTGAAVGKRTATATATGAWSLAGTAVGYRAPKGTVASTLAWTGTAYGTAPTVGLNEGFAFGSTNWAGAATGTTTRRGTATGTWNLAGYAFGVTTRRGSATTGSWSYTGASTAATIRRGLAAGAWSYAGAGTGKRTPKATATTGAWSYTGYAFGQYPRRGISTGTWTFTGTAAALTTHRATGTGAWSFAGAAVGKRIAKATPTGTWTWVGTAVGKRSPKAAPAGAWVFTGYAFGGKPLRGAATGSWQFAGAALARTQHRGLAVGLLAYTGAPVVGVAPALDFADGKATGLRHYVGYAVGLTGIPITPVERILVVAAETRILMVLAETRLLEVPTEPRLITVAAEHRTVEVPAEIRTAQLEGASA